MRETEAAAITVVVAAAAHSLQQIKIDENVCSAFITNTHTNTIQCKSRICLRKREKVISAKYMAAE